MATLKQAEKSKVSAATMEARATEVNAAIAALLMDENTYSFDCDSMSNIGGKQYPDRMTFVLGEKQDREVIATDSSVVIASKTEADKHVDFTKNRWARFMLLISQVDEEAKELNRKTREVAFHKHIGDGFFVRVKDGYMCVGIRRFFMPYGLSTAGMERASKEGISLRLDEWRDLMQIAVPTINHMFPSLASALPCYEESTHLTQAGRIACTSCNPYRFVNDWS